jgi:hypothetical protein
VARAPNPFASVCGRVCAAPCEDVCRRAAIDQPISIRALKGISPNSTASSHAGLIPQDAIYTRDTGEGIAMADIFR